MHPRVLFLFSFFFLCFFCLFVFCFCANGYHLKQIVEKDKEMLAFNKTRTAERHDLAFSCQERSVTTWIIVYATCRHVHVPRWWKCDLTNNFKIMLSCKVATFSNCTKIDWCQLSDNLCHDGDSDRSHDEVHVESGIYCCLRARKKTLTKTRKPSIHAPIFKHCACNVKETWIKQLLMDRRWPWVEGFFAVALNGTLHLWVK